MTDQPQQGTDQGQAADPAATQPGQAQAPDDASQQGQQADPQQSSGQATDGTEAENG